MTDCNKIQKAKLTTIDKTTGESIEIDAIIQHQKKIRITGFFMAMQQELIVLAKMKLRGEALNVLLCMMGRMDYENKINISQKEICEDLNIKSPNVSRAIKLLKESGIIDGHHLSIYHLNSAYGWKGKVHSLRNEEKLKKQEYQKAIRESSANVDIKELCTVPPERLDEVAKKNEDFLDAI